MDGRVLRVEEAGPNDLGFLWVDDQSSLGGYTPKDPGDLALYRSR